jgi:pimeloyl-ACP methyl ester carboxylesterase
VSEPSDYSNILSEVSSRPLEVPLRLRRLECASKGAPAVLILHGGNTCSDIYTVPKGGLAGYLAGAGYDVWLLDWRASRHVLEEVLKKPPRGGERAERREFTIERAADIDVPLALAAVRKEIGDEPRLGVVAWCLSGAVVSVAIARGVLEAFGVSSVVLMTLGLFSETTWNGWLKAEDYLLERVLRSAPRCRAIDPGAPDGWPPVFHGVYERYPRAWLASEGDILHPLSFMVEPPYSKERLDAELQTRSVSEFFGPLHLGFYLQCGQMVRRGFVAPFGAPDVIDRTRLEAVPAGDPMRAFLDPTHFRNKRITLIGAAQNRVWHRDSIDLMYEWLRNNDCRNCEKVVRTDYNIMELLWGAGAQEDVFPVVADGLDDPYGAVRRAAE